VGRHPLEALERTHRQRIDSNNYLMLRSIQGIHAPLRLITERTAAQRIGRLPGLHSSHLMLEVLDGRDELIGFEDVLNGLLYFFSFN
jgi:proteasome maturation protein